MKNFLIALWFTISFGLANFSLISGWSVETNNLLFGLSTMFQLLCLFGIFATMLIVILGFNGQVKKYEENLYYSSDVWLQKIFISSGFVLTSIIYMVVTWNFWYSLQILNQNIVILLVFTVSSLAVAFNSMDDLLIRIQRCKIAVHKEKLQYCAIGDVT